MNIHLFKHPVLMLQGKYDKVVHNESTMKQFNRIKVEKEAKMYINSKHEMYADQSGPVVNDVTAWIEHRLKQKNCMKAWLVRSLPIPTIATQ